MRERETVGDQAKVLNGAGARTGRPAGAAGTDGKSTDTNASGSANRIVVIDERVLTRDLLKRGLEMVGGAEVVAAASVDEWLNRADGLPATLIVLCLSTARPLPDMQQALATLKEVQRSTPVLVMADPNDDIEYVTWMLDHGAQGYIPTDLPLEVAFQVMRLVSAGGTYVPASCLHRARTKLQIAAPKVDPMRQIFTARQAAVLEAVRRGKANKTIAYELNMHESTVKVHVRNIMKKLKASNRTEVVFLTNDLARQDGIGRLAGR
jgi:DNA-binding NarL/FixJ family response regulator